MANERIEAAGLNLEERVIDIWRCATVVKGGKRFSFAVMSVIGNGAGILGVGYGKAREVPNAIEKSVKDAKKNLIRVSTFGKGTIPHEVPRQSVRRIDGDHDVEALLARASSPARRCGRCWNASGSTTCCPSRWADRTTRRIWSRRRSSA